MKRRISTVLATCCVLAAAATGAWLWLNEGVVVPWAAVRGWQLAWPSQLPWLALVWLVPFAALWSLTDLPRLQQVLQVLVRGALLTLVAVALTGPRHRDEAPAGVHVVHVVDRSASVPDSLVQSAVEAIHADADVARKGEKLRVDVVAFDSRAVRLPWPPTQSTADAPLPPLVIERHRGTNGPSGATDLEAALNTALSLVEVGRVPHVVLWTDGIETQGDAASMARALADAKAHVHVPKLDLPPPEAELVVEKLEVPAILRANVPFEPAVIVQTTAAADVTCALTGPGITERVIQASVQKGTQRLPFERLRISEGGRHALKVVCAVVRGSDRFAENNAISARIIVQARPRVLYVEGARGQSMYLERALADDFDVHARGSDGLPRTVAGLKKYAAVVLSDVARVSRSGVPQLTDGDMQNLHGYVKAGGGLLVLGGEDSLGSGGYQNTYLDKHVLPVRMEVESEVQQATIAMVLCIDRSGSMQGTKIELAKEAARATAEALGHDDKIGVFAFDNITRAVVRLQRAGNRYRIATDIGRLTAGGGTNIYPCLQQAYDALTAVSARVKHVILLSDGKAPRSGIDALVHQMRRSGMTVTSVGVGAEVDRGLLEAIADRGGGRSYFTDRPETLPRIFVRETKEVSGESVVERRFRARYAPKLGRVDLLRGVDIASSPLLLGFLPTRTKPGAEELLRTSTGAPLLVRWRRGLGKVTVWTSDLKNRWAHHWIDWPDYAVLARQLVRDLMQEELGMRVAVAVARERDSLRIAVDAVDENDQLMSGLVGAATLRQPDGKDVEVALPEVAMGRYEAVVPMRQLGPYDVDVKLRQTAAGKPLASGSATVVHPYPDEHRIANGAQTALAEIAAATDGTTDATAANWRDHRGVTHSSWKWLWPDLVRFALLLLLIDIALRRVRLGRAGRRTWFQAS